MVRPLPSVWPLVSRLLASSADLTHSDRQTTDGPSSTVTQAGPHGVQGLQPPPVDAILALSLQDGALSAAPPPSGPATLGSLAAVVVSVYGFTYQLEE